MKRWRTETESASRRLTILWVGVVASMAVAAWATLTAPVLAFVLLYAGPATILVYVLAHEWFERRRRRIQRRMSEKLEETIEQAARRDQTAGKLSSQGLNTPTA